jgi:transcriptional regulator GlxA family with amidase domain
MVQIAVYVPQNGVIEAITPAYRLFKTANDFLVMQGKPARFEVIYFGLTQEIKANDGEYTIKVHCTLDEVKRADLIILPAVYGDLDEALKNNAALYPWLKMQHQMGSTLVSLCIGAFLLGEAGLADHRVCSTHWAYCDTFRSKYPLAKVVDGAIITQNDRVYTSGGANSLWNLLLYLLEKYTDRAMAIQASKFFAIEINRESQHQFSIFSGQKKHNDAAVLKLQNYIEQHYAAKTSIEDLAAMTNTSRRNLERRFKSATHNTVAGYMQRVRVEAAKRSFEQSKKNVTEVMYEVGYNDVKAFREVFKKVTGLSPLEYRNRYSN